MWHIKVISGCRERNIRIVSDSVNDLLANSEFRMDTLLRAASRGDARVEIDYKPNLPGRRVGIIRGTKRIIKRDGLFYFSVDGQLKGRGHETRREAWEAKGRV